MSKRILYYDVLNVAACFAVLVLHFNVSSHWFYESPKYVWSLLMECVCYFAVPIFFMLTGATLFGYRARYDTKTFFKKRLVRTVVPFVLWSLIMLVFQVWRGVMEMPMGPRTLINLILNTRIQQVYWFFLPLFMMYLAMPVLSCMTGESFKRPLWYACGLGVLTMAVLPPLCSVVGIEYPGSLVFPLFGGVMVYPVLGYLAATTDFTRRQRVLIYIVGVAAVLLRFFLILAAKGEANEGGSYPYLWTYTGFAGFFPGFAVFVFAKSVDWGRIIRGARGAKVLASVSACSFGIYLIHMALIQLGERYIENAHYELWWITLGPIAAYFICLAVVWLGKKVPVVGRIFP